MTLKQPNDFKIIFPDPIIMKAKVVFWIIALFYIYLEITKKLKFTFAVNNKIPTCDYNKTIFFENIKFFLIKINYEDQTYVRIDVSFVQS